MKSTLIRGLVTAAVLALNPCVALAVDDTFTLGTDPGKDFGKSFTLEAGTYTVTPVKSALTYWPSVKCTDGNPGKCQSGWTTYFRVFSPLLNDGQPYVSTDVSERYSTAEEAVQAAKPYPSS